MGGIKLPEVNSKVFVFFVSTLRIHLPVKQLQKHTSWMEIKQGPSTINDVTQKRLPCDSMSTAGEAGDILCRYKEITNKEEKFGFSKYSPDISVSSQREVELLHWRNGLEMYTPKKHFLSSWLH